MATTITEYDELPRDSQNNILPVGELDATNDALTGTDSVTLQATTRFIRVATDTATRIAVGGAAAATDMLIPAGTVEFFSVKPGVAVHIADA